MKDRMSNGADHRGFTGFLSKDPSSIQSFRLLHPEKRSNNAHHCPSTFHTFGRKRPLRASYPILFSD